LPNRKLQATETAKLELAGQISTQVAALIENSIANQQLNNEDAASVTKIVAASKNLIATEIGRILPMVEMYKKIGKNVEANVRIAYDLNTGFDVAKKVLRKSLEEETKIAHEKF
jgi:L-alanine-DL-glutamate epimerase-like enolase superfamily enzyme